MYLRKYILVVRTGLKSLKVVPNVGFCGDDYETWELRDGELLSNKMATNISAMSCNFSANIFKITV
jgi:hypothetical protein